MKLIAPVVFAPLLWAEVLSFATPLEAVFRIETSLGLTPLVSQDQAPPSRPLAYTVLALLLAARVHDTDGWDVRSLNPQLLGVDDWGPADLTSFPSLTEAMINVFELEVARGIVPAAWPGWMLYRGFTPAAAFDEAGGIHVHGIEISLREIYNNNGCDLNKTANSVSVLIG